MLIDLKDKVAIVTGGGRGIGRELARTLAREGVKVAVADMREELRAEVAEEWKSEGWPGLQLKFDVREAAQCRRVVADVEAGFGRIDILCNNAGVANGGAAETLPEEIWDLNFDSNTKGPFLMAQAVIPVMKRQQAGRIINAASFAATIPSINGVAYASSKAAIVSMTRVLAGELGPFGITVNAYSPGMIPTDMNGYANRNDIDKGRLLDTLTLRRWGEPGDIAKLVCFLASDLADYITGTTIDISGGKFATQMPWVAHREP